MRRTFQAEGKIKCVQRYENAQGVHRIVSRKRGSGRQAAGVRKDF